MSKPKIETRGNVNAHLMREASFVREAVTNENGETEELVRVSCSSEEPYPRWMWDKEEKEWVRGYEVLGHTEAEIEKSRMAEGLVIQDTHWGDQIGIIDKPELKDGKLGGLIRFGCGERAQEIKKDALAGIRRNISIGYIVNDYKKDGTAEDGLPIFRVTSWTPYEASFVNVPADTTVGVGRSASPDEQQPGAAVEKTPAAVQTKERNASMDANQIAALMTQAERAHMKVDEVKSLINDGKTEAEIQAVITERACAYADEMVKKATTPTAGRRAEIFDPVEGAEIQKRYSLMKVLRGLANPKDATIDLGFEREISDEIGKRTSRSARGFFLPTEAFAGAIRAVTGKDNVSSTVTGNGAALVEETLLMSEYIEALVAQTVIGDAGVRTLAGLVGDVQIPKGGSFSAAWMNGENADATQVEPAWSQVPGTPHTIAGNCPISRKLLIQTSRHVETMVQQDMLSAIARGIEAAAFEGSGANGQPTGLAGTTGVGAVTMTAGAPTKANMIAFWEKVLTANAKSNNFKYIMSPAAKALLCNTMEIKEITGAQSAVVGGVSGGYLCKDNKVEGYDVIMSGLCNAKKIYFGAWEQLMLLFWSGVDVVVDPYSLSKKGQVQITAFQDCDVVVRQPAAFAIGTALA